MQEASNSLQNASLPQITPNPQRDDPGQAVTQLDQSSSSLNYASFRKRVFASVLDGTILGFTLSPLVDSLLSKLGLSISLENNFKILAVLFGALPSSSLKGMRPESVESLAFGSFFLGLVILALINMTISIAVILAFYYVPFTYIWGQTLGKKIIKIKVVSVDGTKLTFSKVLKREVLKIILPFSTLSVLFDKNKQGLHDKFAKTYVINII